MEEEILQGAFSRLVGAEECLEAQEKLEINSDDATQLHALIYKYVEGLQWVLMYYYKGVASWAWFYNHHFAPRITDLKGIAEMKFDFELGRPFKPFEQLMGVLPEDSKEHVPGAYRVCPLRPLAVF